MVGIRPQPSQRRHNFRRQVGFSTLCQKPPAVLPLDRPIDKHPLHFPRSGCRLKEVPISRNIKILGQLPAHHKNLTEAALIRNWLFESIGSKKGKIDVQSVLMTPMTRNGSPLDCSQIAHLNAFAFRMEVNQGFSQAHDQFDQILSAKITIPTPKQSHIARSLDFQLLRISQTSPRVGSPGLG